MQANAFFARVFKARAVLGQNVEGRRVFFAQTACGGKAVDNHVLAPSGRAFQTIEHLNRGHRIAVWVVGMCLKPQPSEGKVRRVHFGPHLEMAAIVGFTHIAEQIDHFEQRAVLDRAVHDLAKAIAGDLFQPRGQRVGVRRQLREIADGYIAHQAGIPRFDPVAQPPTFSRCGAVIGVLNQPARIIGDGLAFGREGYGDLVAAGRGIGHMRIGRQFAQ